MRVMGRNMGGIGRDQLLLGLVFVIAFSSAVDDDVFAGLKSDEKVEKLSHFRVYLHDIVGGKNPSAVEIIPPISTTSPSSFGLVRMIDNRLTAGSDRSSKLWGKAQGFYAASSQENISLLMAMNFLFVSGEYNGSSIAILGRNPIGEKVREMPVIGGSGAFRFARGFATATTVKFDPISTSAVVQYDLYLLHY